MTESSVTFLQFNPNRWQYSVVNNDTISLEVKQDTMLPHEWGPNYHVIAVEVCYVDVGRVRLLCNHNSDVGTELDNGSAPYCSQLQNMGVR